jgi:hypothetical protein
MEQKMQERRHSGARALAASPKSKNTGQTNQWLGLCSWVPGPALTGRPGTTRDFFSTLLVMLSAVVFRVFVRLYLVRGAGRQRGQGVEALV